MNGNKKTRYKTYTVKNIRFCKITWEKLTVNADLLQNEQSETQKKAGSLCL